MTVFAFTETVPSTTHPANTLDMFPVANQSLANGDLSTTTKIALPGSVGGGAGVGTFRWLGFGVNNGTTTDQGEPNNTTVTGFGEISCSAVTGPTMPMSAIASGTWTFRLSIAALTYTGTFTFGFRAWQVSADRTVKTLIALAGADASGWVFSGTVTPSATAAVITTITMAATGAVTFGATTPYLYVEALLKVVSIGAATATLAFSNANNTLQVPAVTYSMTGSETTTVSDSGTRAQALGRVPSETTTVTDSASRLATRARTGSETTALSDSAGRATTTTRTGSETTALSDSGGRTVALGRSGSETSSLTDSTVRVIHLFRLSTETTTVSDTAGRVTSSSRTASETTAVTDAATRLTTLGRAASEATTLSDSAVRVSQSIRTGTEYFAGTPDYPVTFPTKSIASLVVNHETGAAVAGATVKLIREDPGVDVHVATTTSAGDGTFSFTRDQFDPYLYHYTSETVIGGVQYHGVSDRGIAPA